MSRIFLASLSLSLIAGAWLLNLFYETSGAAERPFLASAYFPVLAAAVAATGFAVREWLPARVREALPDLRNASFVACLAIIPTAILALAVLARVHHDRERNVQRAVARAVRATGIDKSASCHHSCPKHLV